LSVAICVCGYNNPNYLYIALDNLFRVRKIQNYPVYVFIDNSMDWKTNYLYQKVFEKYPLERSHIYPTHVGDVFNVFESINRCFLDGHDEVIHLEHDWHFRTNLLEYSESIETTVYDSCFAINLGRILRPAYNSWFDNMGMRIKKDNFYELWEWIKGKYYIGQIDPRNNLVMNDNEAFDGKIFMFFQMNGKLMFYCDKSDHIGSFGVTGVHANNNELSQEYDKMFFRGDPHQWLFNVAAILHKGEYPQELETHLFTRYTPLLFDLFDSEHYFDEGI